MFVLTETERIAILCGCIGVLGIVIVLTVCFVCPVCWFYRLLNRRKIEDAEMKCYRDYFSGSFLDRDPPPPYESSTKNFFDLKSPLDFSRRLTSTHSVSTVCSDTDSVTGIPLPLIEDTEIPASEIQESSSFDPGNVSIRLQFKRITGEDKKVFSQLRVDMKEAADLPLRTYGGKCDPYFIVGLYDKSINRRKKKKPEPSPLYQFHTTVNKRSQHPVYNESFFFPLEQKQVKKSVLKIEAWDKDKWANDTALGEVYFNLKDVATILLQQPLKELDLNLKLEDSKKINGQLLLGLCYLPTAERMTVAVLKANNLKTDKNDISDYYVQAMATYEGKVFERRKTSTQPSSSFPVFNEMLMFDVPFAKLDDVVLLLTLRRKASKDTDSYESDKDTCQKATKDECLGKLVIGCYSRKNTLNHWHAMKNSPRRQIIQWHELR